LCREKLCVFKGLYVFLKITYVSACFLKNRYATVLLEAGNIAQYSKRSAAMDGKKIYILDTNVLIHDPQSLFSFDKELIGIPIFVLEELDHFKGENTQRGFSSREVIRNLDILRGRGSLGEGVPLDNGGRLQVLFVPIDQDCNLPLGDDVLDNKIIHLAYCLKKTGYDVEFISKDLNARVKADVLGIKAVDYQKDTVSKDKIYTGWLTLQVPSIQLKKEFPDELRDLSQQYDFTLNEFILVESRHNPYNYNIFRYLGGNQFKAVRSPQLRWPLESRNPQQLMALDLLLDPTIQLVNLIGPAGTGKTFLALLAGLHAMLIEHTYAKMLVTRPVIPLGPDIGYLPGDMREKLHSWMQPIYDNMDFISHSTQSSTPVVVYDDEDSYKGKKSKRPQRDKLIPGLDDLIKEGKMSLEAITYMRGRSIPYQYILIDEVQNLTPHEVKTLISRVGEGSKIVLAGDPHQIDSPYLDFSSNGLVASSGKFKGQALAGTVFLESSERSELSKLAGQLL